MDQFPDITKLPAGAQVIFVIVVAVVWALIHFGVISGRRSKPQPHDVGEIVALTVDSSAIHKLTGEVSGLSVGVHELVAVGKDLVRATAEQADNTDRLREELKEAGKQLRDLGNEISKARP